MGTQLGIILAPYGQIPGAYPSEIGYSYGGDGTFLCPDDPFYNTRGEIGFYHDTQLGRLPTPKGLLARWREARRVKKVLNGLGRSTPSDFEIAPYYAYTPDMDGWVVAKEGFQPGSWIPPNGWNPAGAFGPPMAPPTYSYPGPLGGLGDASTDALIATLNEHNAKIFTLSIITTIAVATSAILAAYRTSKQLKHGG